MKVPHMKGQGSTEYLVLLAVVLIVAMVVIALLGFFPGMSSDAKITESDSYWRGEARPFAILDSQINDTGGLLLIVQNQEADQKVITNFSVLGSGFYGNGTPNGSAAFLGAGEKKNYAVDLFSGSCFAGNVYELEINISYTNPEGTISKTQFGTKKLAGKCSIDVTAP